MKKHWYGLAVLLVALVVAVGCAPAAAPAPAPAPAAPAAPAPAPKAAPEDAAWAQVVEAAKKEGSLTIYASSTFGGPVSRALAEGFQEKYGIQVGILVGSGRGNQERIVLEQTMKKPVADIMQAGLTSLVQVMEKGFTRSVWQELPALRDKSVFSVDPAYSPDGSVLSFVTSAFGPVINTKQVKPDELKSYYDFLNPKWTGKIVIEDPRGGGGTGFAWWGMMKYANILDDDYFRKLGKQMHFFGGASIPMYQMVARGEYAFAASSSDSSVAPLIAEGAPLRMVEMEEGTYVQTLNIGALTHASHPNAAKLFINWLFTQEGQTVYAKSASTAPLRKDVTDFTIPGVLGRPKKILYREWKSNEAYLQYHKEKLHEKVFGAK